MDTLQGGREVQLKGKSPWHQFYNIILQKCLEYIILSYLWPILTHNLCIHSYENTIFHAQ